MSSIVKFSTLLTLGLLLLAPSGCNRSGLDAQALAAHRTRLTLSAEPENVETVADVRAMLLGETGHEDHADHSDHDHDGDGHPDHTAEEHEDHAHDEHDDHDHDGDGHPDHTAEEHDAHDHDNNAHDDHDHDGDGHPDHTAEEHDAHDHDAHDHDAHDHDAHDHDAHEGHAPAGHATEPQQVAMVGHVGGLPNPWANVHPDYPFAKGQAVLFLSDPQAVIENAASGHQHAPGEECAFCAANAADKSDLIALVQFVDAAGHVLPVDVQQLLDVQPQDMVVVQGKARVTAGGILVLDAQGIYLRK